MKSKEISLPNSNSERVVVDEILGNGTVRLLRAKRLEDIDSKDLSIDTWSEEEEYVMESWRVEAFVGFPNGRQLNEADVFFIRDGRRLHEEYKPIPREKARQIHLLRSWDDAKQIARNEIKHQHAKLSAKHTSTGKKKEINSFYKRIDKKYK
jgi:hypothetical protein